LTTWNEQAGTFSYTNNFIKMPENLHPSSIAYLPGTQKYYIGIQEGGMGVFDRSKNKFSSRANNIDKEAIVEKIPKELVPLHSMMDSRGRYWFISWHNSVPYVYCFDTKTNDYAQAPFEFATVVEGYTELNDFFETKNGDIWVKGFKVLAKFLQKEKTFQVVYNGYTNERSIAYESVSGLCGDRENNIWIATDNNGLYRFNPTQDLFTNVNHTNRTNGKPGAGTPMSFMATKWGTILVGTWEDGFYHYDNNFNLIPTGIKGIEDIGGPYVWSMYASKDSNTLWLSSQPGLYVVDQKKRAATFHNPPVLQNRTIRQVVEDKNGNLWLGMQSIGLYKWKAVNGKPDLFKDPEKFSAVPAVQVNKIIVDSKNYIWVGTTKNGLYVINPETDKIVWHFGMEEKGPHQLPEEGISSILEYNDSSVIITTGTRVILYNRLRNHSRYIGQPDIMSGYIASVEKDKNSHVWIATSGGLYRANISNNVFLRFNWEDGIQKENFSLVSSAVLPDGRMLFGTSTNFIAFNPSNIQIKSPFLDIKITDFKVLNKSLSVDSLLQLKEIELGYKENSILVEFSSLLYNNPCLIKYKLEGIDKEWRYSDESNQVAYNYLPPKNYKLLLKAVDEDGNEGTEVLEVNIKVNPPFWKTWWFYSLLVLLSAALLFWFDRERMKRKEALQKMRSDIAGNLHQEVSTALNNINILSEMASIKADKEPQKSKEFIDQIQTKSHNMIITMDDMLWSIEPGNDNMGKTILRMKEFIDGLNNGYGRHLEMVVDKKVSSLAINMKLRHEVFLLFKECIQGLVNGNADYCRIHAGLDKAALLFNIEVKNAGCDLQHFYNLLNRQDLAKRLAAINAQLQTQIHKSNSVILLKVPLL
jgi:hypothetical protein